MHSFLFPVDRTSGREVTQRSLKGRIPQKREVDDGQIVPSSQEANAFAECLFV